MFGVMESSQDLEETLKGLALKGPENTYKERVLLDHEVAIFETSYAHLRSHPDLSDVRVRVLRHALWNRNYDLVSRLLAEVDEKVACLRDQLDIMRALILHHVPARIGPMPDEPESLPEMLTVLLRHGASAAIADRHGECPLYFACKRGYSKTFQLLLASGAHVGQLISVKTGKHGDTETSDDEEERLTYNLLQTTWREWAIWHNCSDTRDYRSGTLEAGHGSIIMQLVDSALEMDPPDPTLISVYHMVCFHGHLDRVRKLTKQGVNAQQQSTASDGAFSVTFALQAAAVGCQVEVVEFLLEHGASRSSRGPVYLNKWAQRHNPERSLTALVAALYYHRKSEGIYNICQLLFDPDADQDDLRCLLYFSIEQGWMEMVKNLLARHVRIDVVPLCLDIAMIDLLVGSGAYIHVKRFLQYALNRGSLEVLTYLGREHSARLELHEFAHVALGILQRYHYHQWDQGLKRRNEYAEIIKYLLASLDLSVNSVFRMAKRANLDPDFEDWDSLKDVSDFADCEICSTDGDAYTPIRFGDDTTDPGVQTSLLRLACEWELFPAVQWLIEDEGADAACPGLPHCALDYYVRRPPLETRLIGDDLDERLVLLLLERSSNDDVKYWEQQLVKDTQQNICDIRNCTTWKSSSSQQSTHNNNEHCEDAKTISPLPYSSQASPFSYEALRGDKAIRLFHLEASTSLADPLCGTLSHQDPFDCPPFEALSYVWGNTRDNCAMSLDKKSFHITTNLAAALVRLRRFDRPRILWVDAICINQQDNDEKGRQVSMMGNIYQRATTVLVWLGEHFQGSQLIFEWHKNNEEKIKEDAIRQKEATGAPNFYYDGEVATAFQAICKRPYWYRTWILQEVGLGHSATIMCGPDNVDLRSLIRFGKGDQWQSDYHPIRGPQATRHAERVTQLAIYCDISRVATLTRCCQCKDPRDKVFGVLGLLASKPIPVRYDVPIADTYRSFTKAIIEHRRDLLALHWLGPNRSLTGLDSWVPDWSISKPVGVLRRVLDAERLGWQLKDPPELYFSGRELSLKGVRLDVIRSVGGTLSVPDEPNMVWPEFQKVMLHWEQLVLPEVHKSGIKALEAFARTLHAEDDYCRNKKQGGRILFPFVMWYHHRGTGFLKKESPRAFELVELAMVMLAQIQDWNDFELSMQDKIWRYTENMEVSCYGRQLYLTEKGSMGLAPPGARIGDEVVFFPGGSYPFVVRRNDDERTWQMVGDCHLENLDVDVVKATPKEDFTLR